MSMSFIYLIITLFMIIVVGLGVTYRFGWRAGFGAAIVALLFTGGAYVGLVFLIVNSMG